MPPRWSPAPEVAPTAWRARTRAGSSSVPSARSHAAYSGSTSPFMAQSSSVADSRVVRSGAVPHDLVDLGRRDPGGPVERQPAGEHVVPERGQSLATTEQVGGRGRVDPAAREV